MPLATPPQGVSLDVEESLRGVVALGLLEVDDVRLEPVPEAFSVAIIACRAYPSASGKFTRGKSGSATAS